MLHTLHAGLHIAEKKQGKKLYLMAAVSAK